MERHSGPRNYLGNPQQRAFRAHDADCVLGDLDTLGERPDVLPPIAALSRRSRPRASVAKFRMAEPVTP